MQSNEFPKIVGYIDEKVIAALNLSIEPGTPIFLGQTNIEHMKTQHPGDFERYFDSIKTIIAAPDYVIPHPKEPSLQYIKILDNHVLVAVKLSISGRYWVRTMFIMSEEKIVRYTRGGLFKHYTINNKRP